MLAKADIIILGLHALMFGIVGQFEKGDLRTGGGWFPDQQRLQTIHGVNWHTLWHTFASRPRHERQPESTIAALLKHSGTDLVRLYAHLSPAYLRSAVESVATFGKKPSRGNSKRLPRLWIQRLTVMQSRLKLE